MIIFGYFLLKLEGVSDFRALQEGVNSHWRAAGGVNPTNPPVPMYAQGSILGPLLFLVYFADLPRAVSHPTQIRLFADDAKIFRKISGRDDEIGLQNDLKEICSWCKT